MRSSRHDPPRLGAAVPGCLRCRPMDQGWTIDIDAVGDPATAGANFDLQVVEFELALDPYSGAVAASAAQDRYGARFSLDTESISPVEVLEQGLEVFHDAAIAAGLPAWQV